MVRELTELEMTTIEGGSNLPPDFTPPVQPPVPSLGDSLASVLFWEQIKAMKKSGMD